MEVYLAQDVKVKATKQENQASKICLLNVVFSNDFFNDVVKMNDKKQKNELYAGKGATTSIFGAAFLMNTMTRRMTKLTKPSLSWRMNTFKTGRGFFKLRLGVRKSRL
jgi:hypothetical protein